MCTKQPAFSQFGFKPLFQTWNKQNSVCKQNDGAEINTLISISNGLGPSIFCRNMVKTCPMREEMDRKVVYFPPGSAIRLWCFKTVSIFPTCTLNCCVNNYVSLQGKGINRRDESTKTQVFYQCFWEPTIISSMISFSNIKYWNCEKYSGFLQRKTIK